VLKREIVRPPEHLFPADEWRVVESRWTEAFSARTETAFALSNGYLGMRGSLEEGRPAYMPGTFVNGFHETWPIAHPEQAYGLARVGQTMVAVPDATVFQLLVDDEPLYLPTARLREYARVLDMRNGTLSRDLLWTTPAGKHVRVRSTRLVSLEHRHVAAMSYEVTIDRRSPVVVVSRILGHGAGGPAAGDEDPRLGRRLDHHVLQEQFAEGGDGRVVLGYRTANSGMTLAVGVDHHVDVPCRHDVATSVRPGAAELVLTADAEPDVPLRIVKYATYQTSRAVPAEELGDRCRRTLARIGGDGFDALRTAQRENLDRFWDRADVVVEDGRPGTVPVRVQQAVRWNLFELGQASWRAEGSGIPAKGLTGGAYDGHYFWDTEAYVLPFLAYTQPRTARNLLRFRHSMLPKARQRAADLGQRGATFPWRTINGEEASAYYQAGTAQYHLNADIAYAIKRYVDVRGDDGFLLEAGAEVLIETARMWEDLGFYGEDGRFHIHGVTGPDEYTTVVNDNAFTNLMARLNLRYAASVARRLAATEPAAWAALREQLALDPIEVDAWDLAADLMHVPYDPVRKVTPQDDTFLEREMWDLEATPPGQVPAPPALPPTVDLPPPGAEAGRRGHGHVHARQRVRPRAEAPQLRVLRQPDHGRLLAVGQRAERGGRRDRRGGGGLPVLRLRPAHGSRRRGRERLQRGSHRLRRGRLDGDGLRLRRRPGLRRAADLRPPPPGPVERPCLLAAVPRPPGQGTADPRGRAVPPGGGRAAHRRHPGREVHPATTACT
jgi:alpha,alpha-trehalose phosphorylase